MLSFLKRFFCSHNYLVLFHKEQKSPFQELIEKDPDVKLDDIRPWLFQSHVMVVLKCQNCHHVHIVTN